MRDLKGVRALVVGLGRSGEAAAEFLVARGAVVAVSDTKEETAFGPLAEKLRGMGVRLHLGDQGPDVFRDRDVIVVSPGVPWDLPALAEARSRGVEVIGDVELAAPFLKGSVIGVTGSNGKTTTTAMIGHLLRTAGLPVQVGGNIGMGHPPVTVMAEHSTPATWNVIELSSFQLEAIRDFRADIAVVLNVTPDHLDRHRTFESYAAAKERLLNTQRPEDWAVLNFDDPTCVAYGERARSQVIWFSRRQAPPRGTWVQGDEIVFGGTRVLAQASSVPLPGAHNLENALAATTAAYLATADSKAIREGVRTFRPVEHRLEFVRTVNGVAYYNDSKATNVDATGKALEAFEGKLWVILGGKDKGGDYTVLSDLLRRKARGVLLIGAAAAKIAGQLGDAAPLYEAGTLDRAVELASQMAQPGDTVLLAPACASFDQFENYEHRGRVFKQLVSAL